MQPRSKVSLYHVHFTNSVTLMVIYFLLKLIDKKNVKVKFDSIPKTNEDYLSVTYGCIRFIDRYRLLSSSLDSLVKTQVDNNHITLKNLNEEFVDIDE